MSQTMINFRIDADVKKQLENVCNELGMSLSTAFTIFARKVIRDERIPFDVSIDSFYSKNNIEMIQKSVNEIKKGKTVKKTMKELEMMENE